MVTEYSTVVQTDLKSKMPNIEDMSFFGNKIKLFAHSAVEDYKLIKTFKKLETMNRQLKVYNFFLLINDDVLWSITYTAQIIFYCRLM